MTFYVTNQNRMVLILVLLGAFFGIFGDLVRVKRRFFKTGRIAVFAEDLLCFVICTAIFEITVFVTNYGYFRWYEFVSLVAGYMLYVFLLQDAVVWVLVGVAGIVSSLVRTVLSPFVRMCSLLFKIIEKNFGAFGEFLNERTAKYYSAKTLKRIAAMSERGFEKRRKGILK